MCTTLVIDYFQSATVVASGLFSLNESRSLEAALITANGQTNDGRVHWIPLPGAARKTRERNTPKDDKQLMYLNWVFNHGNDCGTKFSAEVTHRYMALHGTTDGESLFLGHAYWVANGTNTPTFSIQQRLPVWTIKQFFSQTKANLTKSLKAGSAAAAPATVTDEYSQMKLPALRAALKAKMPLIKGQAKLKKSDILTLLRA
jgi:hypothetical protein